MTHQTLFGLLLKQRDMIFHICDGHRLVYPNLSNLGYPRNVSSWIRYEFEKFVCIARATIMCEIIDYRVVEYFGSCGYSSITNTAFIHPGSKFICNAVAYRLWNNMPTICLKPFDWYYDSTNVRLSYMAILSDVFVNTRVIHVEYQDVMKSMIDFLEIAHEMDQLFLQ